MRETWTKKKVFLQRKIAEACLEEPKLLAYDDLTLEAYVESEMKGQGHVIPGMD